MVVNNKLSQFEELEIGLIGSILIDGAIFPEVREEINEYDFVIQNMRTIFHAMNELYEDDKVIDGLTVAGKLGPSYRELIAKIIEMTPTSANWPSYADGVKRQSKVYYANVISSEIFNDSSSIVADVDELKKKTENLLVILDKDDTRTRSFSMKRILRNFIDNLDKPRKYIDWGFTALNENIMCDQGKYIILGARPSVGKTAFALQIAINLAKNGEIVDFFSYETDMKTVSNRMMSTQSKISFDKIMKGNLSNDEIVKITQVARSLYNLPFTLIESSGMTVDQIRSKSIKDRATVIFIDYLQLIPTKGKPLEDFQRITQVSMEIQQLCKRYNITVFALSQLSRAGESGEPTSANLRSSGQIEQDADVVMLLYRPHKIEEGEEDTDRVLKTSKNKNGRTGKKLMKFNGEYQLFTEI